MPFSDFPTRNRHAAPLLKSPAPSAEALLATGGAGDVLALILSGRATSRSALEKVSGLSRATVSLRLSTLFDAGLVVETEHTVPSGGRPARALGLNVAFGEVLAIDVGESMLRVALLDLTPEIHDDVTVPLDVASGPQAMLEEMLRCARLLLERRPRPQTPLLGIGVSLPAPVDYAGGKVFGPSVMRGWDGFGVRETLTEALGVPAFVDNDVNLMTLAEQRTHWPDTADLVFIKAGTGIGSGIVAGGRVYRGARGVSGDIGHIQFDGPEPPLCRCGKRGCVEARAAGWAIARDLKAAGVADARSARDVLACLEAGHPEAIERVRAAGRVLGQVAADVVSILNPAVIVLGGTMAQAGEHLLAGLRELVYKRCLPLAVEHLTIAQSRLGADAGLLGAAQLAVDERLRPGPVEILIAQAQHVAAG